MVVSFFFSSTSTSTFDGCHKPHTEHLTTSQRIIPVDTSNHPLTVHGPRARCFPGGQSESFALRIAASSQAESTPTPRHPSFSPEQPPTPTTLNLSTLHNTTQHNTTRTTNTSRRPSHRLPLASAPSRRRRYRPCFQPAYAPACTCRPRVSPPNHRLLPHSCPPRRTTTPTHISTSTDLDDPPNDSTRSSPTTTILFIIPGHNRDSSHRRGNDDPTL